MRTPSTFWLVAALVILLGIASAHAQQNSTHAVTEIDPGLGLALDLPHNFRLDLFAGREKSEDIHAGKEKFSVGTSFRVKPLFKSFLDDFDSDKQHLLVIGVAYEYSRGSDHDVVSREHKIMVDATGRRAFRHKLLLNNRNRFEFRWVDGESRFRYRNRLMLEKAFKLGKRSLTPYAGAEAMWDRHYDRWNQFRYTGGIQVPFIKRTSFDAFYERVRCLTCSDLHTNVFGLTLNVYLRLKKK